MSILENNTALVLSGGGARAAYQVGVLQAIKDILPPQTNPFPIIAGTSAGAINAVSLASNSDDFQNGVEILQKLWSELTIEHVFRTGWRDISGGVYRIARSFFNEGVDYHRPLSLLDNSPLNSFLKQHIDFPGIQANIEHGILKAVSVAALGYTSSNSVNFFQGEEGLGEWNRFRRIGVRTQIGMEHLLASSAIPLVFPTVRIGSEYFGDGAMRQLAPISPVLHLGADKAFIIGVSGNRAVNLKRRRAPARHPPSMAQMAGQMLNSAFIDSLEADIEHLERVNELVGLVPEDVRQDQKVPLRPIKTLIISPSKELDKIAGRHIRYLPKSLRFFLRSSGATARRGGSGISSYLLFSPSFTNELIELGYQDAMWEKEAIQGFFSS
ncbi:MAG: NTE family protein [Cellvibrionaceae bacterium]|jgi:NTE family protein